MSFSLLGTLQIFSKPAVPNVVFVLYDMEEKNRLSQFSALRIPFLLLR